MKINLKRVLPFTVAVVMTPFILSGCSKKSECEVPTRHVHRYTKKINDDITITKYFDNESLNFDGYEWHDDYLEITKDDEEFYRLTSNLFNGKENWNYLYNFMASQYDYLKFYYEYDTTETDVSYDEKGNPTYTTHTVHHDGWTSNPNDSNNTGKTRLYHPRYYGYRIIYNNGRYFLEKSRLVDDVREIINDYPYVAEDFCEYVYKQYKFSRYQLRSLKVTDFTDFDHPDLTNKSIELNPNKTLKK